MIKEFLQLHGEYHDDKSFKDLTTLKMGGPIAHFVMPESEEELKVIVNYLKNEKIPFKVIGNGSNLICGESRYDGVVISLKDSIPTASKGMKSMRRPASWHLFWQLPWQRKASAVWNLPQASRAASAALSI